MKIIKHFFVKENDRISPFPENMGSGSWKMRKSSGSGETKLAKTVQETFLLHFKVLICMKQFCGNYRA